MVPVSYSMSHLLSDNGHQEMTSFSRKSDHEDADQYLQVSTVQ